MNEKEIVKKAMGVRGYTQVMLANLLGYKTQSGVSEKFRGQSMRVTSWVKMLNAMGFDVIVQDRNSKNKENKWTVGDDEK